MINFDRLDLNLLRVFDAVMEERSALRAGRKLHLSQSAVSHALTRLRENLGEELFVRTGKGMTPTAYALDISVSLRAALQSMAATLARAGSSFDAATASRSFVIAANDYVSAILMPPFNRLLARAAPGVDIVIRPSTRLDLAEQIDLGRIDIAIGMFRSVPARLRAQALMHQDEVLVMGPRHPLAGVRLNVPGLARYPLAVVSLGGPQDGAISGFILERGLARQSEMYDRQSLEAALGRAKLRPRIQCTIPHFLVIPMLLEDSELVSIVPRPLAEAFVKSHAIVIKALPYKVKPQRVDAVWHSQNDTDPAHRWLREQLGLILGGLGVNP